QRLTAATLVVDWPTDEREGGELRVNQRPVKLSNDEKLVVVGRPGAWGLSLERDGFEPIRKTVTMRRGERFDFIPEWQPTPRTVRRAALQKLEKQVETRASLDVLSSAAVALRADLVSFLCDHPASPEAQAARKLAARLQWPPDLLNGRGVPA